MYLFRGFRYETFFWGLNITGIRDWGMKLWKKKCCFKTNPVKWIGISFSKSFSFISFSLCRDSENKTIHEDDYCLQITVENEDKQQLIVLTKYANDSFSFFWCYYMKKKDPLSFVAFFHFRIKKIHSNTDTL